jgi:hypothetical protein
MFRIKNIIKWFSELFYSECPKCKTNTVKFSHEEHFSPGSPDVYYCKNCKEYFI